ncbi:MAG TPA: cysteine dioxygenase family protein [Actinomycetota bacterium]
MSSALTQLVLPPIPKPESDPARDTLGPLDLGILADIASGLACSVIPDGQDGFAGIEPQGSDLRRFARLLHTPAYEAWLIAWEAAADLELHDHGGSQGAFYVVDGALVEAHADLVDPAPLQTLLIGAGEGRDVTPTRVHRVWNPGPARAVSVHVYSPPLSSMTFYDDQPGTFLTPLRTDFVEGAPEPGGAR